MDNLLESVEKSILGRRLLSRGDAVLAAVSGGIDSMVLLHLLVALAPRHGWRVAVAHLNHGLRGRRSDGDEKFVACAAARLGCEFVLAKEDVKEAARQEGESVEMAGRRLRHAFLARMAKQLGIRTVAVAHHADDQVELFLLRILRGVGGEALGGMKWKGASSADKSITLIRPLLGQEKEALRAYAAVSAIESREDHTNASLDFQRNRIRNELIPLLKQHYQPALARVILREMEILGSEGEFAGEEAKRWLAGRRKETFTALAPAVQRRCLHIQLADKGLCASFEQIEELRMASGKAVSVDNKWQAIRTEGGEVELVRAEVAGFGGGSCEMDLGGTGGSFVFDNVEFAWRKQNRSGEKIDARKKPERCELFDADRLGSRVMLRHWRAGDRFQPLGMGSAVKLQDLFTNQKVLRASRHQLIVGVASDGGLFWVEGLRMGERYKLGPETRARLEWQWKRRGTAIC